MAAQQFAGWKIRDEDGLHIATRDGGLSTYMRENGAIAELSTRNYDELLLLINAQVTLVLNLAKAENVYLQDVQLRRERAKQVARAAKAAQEPGVGTSWS